MTPIEDVVTVPITGDPLLVGALLLRVMTQIDEAPNARAAQCATIADLRDLSPLETWRLGGMRKSGLSLLVDIRQLAENLRALRHINAEATLIAYFVRHGASRAMLHQLFHVSHDVLARQRRRLGVHVGHGRPALPDKSTRDAIHRSWAEICRDEPDARRRLVRLHQQFSTYKLVVLNAVIHEFDAPR